jgi:hypothetical protein
VKKWGGGEGRRGGGSEGGRRGGGMALGTPPFRTKGVPSELNCGGESDNTVVSSAGLEGVCWFASIPAIRSWSRSFKRAGKPRAWSPKTSGRGGRRRFSQVLYHRKHFGGNDEGSRLKASLRALFLGKVNWNLQLQKAPPSEQRSLVPQGEREEEGTSPSPEKSLEESR